MSFILSSVLGMEYRRKLQVVYDQLPKNAAESGATSCCSSARCCWHAPCTLGPDDPKAIADHFGITPQELFARDLVVDTGSGGSGTLILRPRRKQQQGGIFLDYEATYDADTPCVYLDSANKCSIHEVKPLGGRAYKCWEGSSTVVEPAWLKEDLIALGWNGVEE